MSDDRALKILIDTFWSGEGWSREPAVSPENFAYAKEAGLMFDPLALSHDEVISWAVRSANAVALADVRNAFLVSLTTRRLELRSALGSYAVASRLPVHAYQGDDFCCAICGLFKDPGQPYDLNVLNFERYKWGGVRHEQPEYAAFDLSQMANLIQRAGPDTLLPTDRDLEILRQILQTARQSLPDERPRDLEKRLSLILNSEKEESEILIQILGYCGILQSKHHPGYSRSFVEYGDRTVPLERTYWTYPVIWWRGVDGVNEEAVEYYFPDLW